ncbi:MAG: asparagine synthase (glutamine-hydrolyzing) [Bacteroidetes bacterium]|nr:asparagine synthase (glutamine-hydrolyzing) [Bacteroidota bacterium]MBS1930854.1 asparagine synthase (glutamine-hydrolyzing) [Bacteroidota bacterium]
MCGIAGSINYPINSFQLDKNLGHRGPDEKSVFTDQNLELHHYRLSILDIAGGRQPMHYEHLTIIFNGEIYNHNDLRKKYALTGKTNSDTETILLLYARLGPSCLEDMDGMFSMIIYDRKKQELFLARDRAGKKPFYYYSDSDKFLFASELNAIRHQVNPEMNEEHLAQFVRIGYFYKTSTPYKNVHELPGGSYAYVSLKNPRPVVTKWWDIHQYYLQKSKDDFSTALNKIDNYLHTAVKRRVESSDLEVGSFLSGGIDSGIISAIAKQYNSTLKTFTVSFEGEYNEAPLAALVAKKYETDHYELKISFDHLKDETETILYNYGEPFFDSSAIPSYYVSREAKKHLTVILNGDGGDEMFGGYRRYVPAAKFDFFKNNPFLRIPASLALKLLPESHNKKSRYNYFYRLMNFTGKKGLETYLSATIDSFDGLEKNLKADPNLLQEMQNGFERINKSGLTGLKKMMNLDFDNILFGDLLVKMDIATMSNSLEGRSPLLCKEFLEYVPGLPDHFKIRGTTTKYILRKLAEKYLPAELIHQPKRGFEIPLKKWIDGPLHNLIADNILTTGAFCKNFVRDSFIGDLWKKKIKTSDEKRAKMIWTLFALEVWYKKCYLKNA